MIVRARALSQQVRHAPLPGRSRPAGDDDDVAVVEVVQGADLSSSDTLTSRFRRADAAGPRPPTGFPDAAIRPGAEFILLLARMATAGSRSPSLAFSSTFTDAGGRTFAVRPVFRRRRRPRFPPDDDDRALCLGSTVPGTCDAGSFLAILRRRRPARGPLLLYATPPARSRGLGFRPTGEESLGQHQRSRGIRCSISLVLGLRSRKERPRLRLRQTGPRTARTGSAVQNGAAQWSAVADTDVRTARRRGQGRS